MRVEAQPRHLGLRSMAAVAGPLENGLNVFGEIDFRRAGAGWRFLLRRGVANQKGETKRESR